MKTTEDPATNPIADLIIALADLEAQQRSFGNQSMSNQTRYEKTVGSALALAPCLDAILERLKVGWTLEAQGQQIYIEGMGSFANIMLNLESYTYGGDSPYSFLIEKHLRSVVLAGTGLLKADLGREDAALPAAADDSLPASGEELHPEDVYEGEE
jgi:hypothetical protein